MARLTEKEQALVNAIVDVAGGFGSGIKDVVEGVAHKEHRTHQQTITRFCKAWLTLCGSEEYGHDGRNDASAELGKKFVEAGLDEHYLPYVQKGNTMSYYDERTKKAYCHEDCMTSRFDGKSAMSPSGWVVVVEQGGYYDLPAILYDVKCCPKCMRRLLADGTTLLPETWREENV